MRWSISECLFAGACLLFGAGGDWLQFRGNDSTGAAAGARPPVRWGKTEDGRSENVAWRVDLVGRGVSGPIVVSGKVVVTCSSGFQQDRLHVLCFDAASGRLEWQRQFWASGRTLCHPTSAVAAPTPASDGQRIFAFYSSNDLVCLDLAGNLRWLRGLTYDYPTAANDVGMAASPVVVGDTVVVQVENKGDSFAAGLDTATGGTRWRVARDRQMNWTSPTLVRGPTPAEDLVLLQSPSRLTAHDPATGRQLWSHAASSAVIASAVGGENAIYLPAAGLTAFGHPSGSAAPEVLWTEAKLGPDNASPVLDAGRLYTLNSAPVLSAADAATGEVLWRLRLKGTFWATPVIAGGHIYCVNQDGLAQVVRLGDQGEVVGENDLGESILASPAAADGTLYFRSDRHLWKIAEP